MSEHGLPLPTLFTRALQSASKAYLMPTNQDETQELLQSALRDLQRVQNGIESLALFSSNESAEDLATGDIVYILVPYILSEVISRVSVENEVERCRVIEQSQRLLREFLERVENYSISLKDDTKLARQANSNLDSAARREVKIRRYKKEKEIRGIIQSLGSKWGTAKDTDDFMLINSLVQGRATDKNVDDDGDDENLRECSILLVRLFLFQAYAQLRSMDEELDMLRQIESTRHVQGTVHSEIPDTTWRIDQLTPINAFPMSGPLMDSGGKPLRPFTILPSTSTSERARLRDEVFRPDHRLPTMTIDEYLEEERRRGNIISGGGPSSREQPTSMEQLALDAENDGSIFGEQKSEEKRKRDEEWAIYTDSHPKGMGNTMNRG